MEGTDDSDIGSSGGDNATWSGEQGSPCGKPRHKHAGQAPLGRPRRVPEDGYRRNPENHRRYYARKKALLADLAAELEAKQGMVANLSAQNQQLHNREKVLLSSIKVQDERLQVLEQGLASLKLEADRNSSGPLPDLSLSSPADGPLDEAAQGAQMTEDVQLLLTQTEELLVCAGTPLRGEDGMQQEEQQQQPQPQLKQEPAAGASSSAPALAASPPQLQPPPGGEVITKAQCIHLYEAFVREVASLLTAVQERKPEALAKVHELTQALDEQLRSYFWNNPSDMIQWRGMHLYQPGVYADDSVWENVAGVLVPDDGDAVAAAIKEHDMRLAALFEERALVAARLRELLQQGHEGEKFFAEDSCLEEMSLLAEQLQQGLKKEDELWAFVYKTMHHLTTPEQRARIAVACYPFWPDGVALMRIRKRNAAARRAAQERRQQRGGEQQQARRCGSK